METKINPKNELRIKSKPETDFSRKKAAEKKREKAQGLDFWRKFK